MVGLSRNAKTNVDAGYLTWKVICLVESLLEYRFVSCFG